MLKSGYCKLSRGWKNDSASPFYGRKRRRYYEVWRELCEQASYDDTHGTPVGTLTMSLAELSDAVDQPRRSVLNAIQFCERLGLISICARLPKLTINLAHYDLLECLHKYLEKIAVFESGTAEQKQSGTATPIPSSLKSLDNLDISKTIWHSTKKSGTDMAQEGHYLSMRNDKDKQAEKKQRENDLAQKRPFFKNHNNKLLLRSNSSVGSAHADRAPAIKAKRTKKTTKAPPTEWQIRIGSLWAEHLAKLFPGTSQNATKQVAGLQAVQLKHPDLDEALVERVLVWATTHRHWKRALLNLGGLMNAYRPCDGAPKLLAMVADMDAEAERNKRSQPPPKKTWAGEVI